MPLPPPYPPIRARNAKDAILPKQNNDKFIDITVCIAAIIIAIGLLIRWKGWAWYRSVQAAKVARKKALADQQVWYKSTRPIYRRPETPRLWDVYSRIPHVQKEERSRDSAEKPITAPGHAVMTTPLDEGEWFAGGSSNAMMPRRTSDSPLLRPFAIFDPEGRPAMDPSGGDIGMQPASVRDSHMTTTTMGTTVSVGVAVPMSLPASSSPTEFYKTHSIPSRSDDSHAIGVAVPESLPSFFAPK